MFGTTARATLIVAAKDEASDTMAKLAAQAKRGGEAVEGLGRSGAEAAKGGMLLQAANVAAAGAIAGLGVAAVAAAREGLDLAMAAEQNAVAFETLMGSAAAAQKHLEDLRDFAASTPFQFTDLVEASKKMQALGFEAEQVVPMLTDIGDAVAAMGGNSQMIDRVVMAMGQMQAKGKATGEELMQMTEAGIPALKYMAQQAGVSTAEMQKLISKGLVPADEAIQAILAGMREDFGGMMAKQADTATGAVSNLEDAWKRVLQAQMAANTGIVKDSANATSGFLTMNAVMTEIQNNPALDQWQKWSYEMRVWGGWASGQGTQVMEEVAGEIKAIGEEANEAKHKISSMARAAETARWEGIAQQWAQGNQELGESFNYAALAAQNLSTLMSGPLGNEIQDNRDATAELTAKQTELRAEIDKLTASNGAYWEHVEHSGASQAELTLTTLQLQRAQEDLGEALGKTGDEYDPMKIAQLNVQIERLQGELTGATTVTNGYIDNSKKVGELTTEYNAVTDEIRAQEEAHTKATRQILFNILQQQVANMGYSEEAGGALMLLAKDWGLIDAATYAATQRIIGGVKDAAESGDWSTLYGNIDGVRRSMEGIPAYVKTVYEFETRYTQTGSPSAGAGDVGIQGWTPPSGVTVPTTPTTTTEDEYDDKLAFGGPASAGGTYLWQESAMSRPEVFVPGTSGAVLTRQQAESMFGAHGGGGGDVAAAIRSLPRMMAREIQTAIQFAIVRGG